MQLDRSGRPSLYNVDNGELSSGKKRHGHVHLCLTIAITPKATAAKHNITACTPLDYDTIDTV